MRLLNLRSPRFFWTRLLATALLVCAFACESRAAWTLGELKRIMSAGGSAVIDLEKTKFGAAELAALASALKGQATLTIIMSSARKLTTSECVLIASKRPGRVIFWY